ncbi:hypothetical protein BCR44DRAFT_1433883 [Catenaria anguillulae PL171]|uniref:Uncharacterized protein n=1 Tax=Catenaria anguillulae PL171 TaxID=765915 RepID=A0A1Y2HP98_9FUNG|nr:hypothetical protein BCR44DRAFT_1433883 [Catenaria anguillulae PL171]
MMPPLCSLFHSTLLSPYYMCFFLLLFPLGLAACGRITRYGGSSLVLIFFLVFLILLRGLAPFCRSRRCYFPQYPSIYRLHPSLSFLFRY